MSKGKRTAADVAEYILDKIGPTTAMKVQKLVYYLLLPHPDRAWLTQNPGHFSPA